MVCLNKVVVFWNSTSTTSVMSANLLHWLLGSFSGEMMLHKLGCERWSKNAIFSTCYILNPVLIGTSDLYSSKNSLTMSTQ